MSYRIAGIDVHKKMLAVVVSDVEIESEYQWVLGRYGISSSTRSWHSFLSVRLPQEESIFVAQELR